MVQPKSKFDMRLEVVQRNLLNRVPVPQLSEEHGVSIRTIRHWIRRYRDEGAEGLRDRSRAPHNPRKLSKEDEDLILKAIRISYLLLDGCGKKLNYRTIHRVLKKHDLMVRVKPKKEPCKRFERKHPDSLWQMDIHEFRIRGVGRVKIFGIIDDHSRWVPAVRIYKRKTAANAVDTLKSALINGRKPEQLYVDNGRQFIAKCFRKFCEREGIKLIIGRPYNPQARGKIEAFFKILRRELISQVVFASLEHAQLELSRFQGKYNKARRHGGIGWIRPEERYNRQTCNINCQENVQYVVS